MVKQQPFWQDEAVKLGIPHLGKVIGELLEGKREILTKLDEMEKRQVIDRLDIDAMAKAFPSKDFDGHGRYHQALIENTEERRRLRIAIREKTISGLIWSAIVWGAAQIWNHLPKLFEGVNK